MAKQKRKIVQGIEHGLSGYTNYGCRCRVCTEANRRHHQDYRARRYAGNPLCDMPNCHRLQSRAYGNGLCYVHAKALIHLRRTNPAKARRVERQLGLVESSRSVAKAA